ncbi:ABC transporter ATP-binding protein [Orrella sp. JC864]|uniref:dipeptide ABC transporter ATP-binding protein n=1 Tax=Orrella sp. JC864 TaxID=3120298 RepID=UPI0012BCB583
MSELLLEIENLNVGLPTQSGTLRAVRGMDLALRKGEALGIVGESGSGKSMTALALMRLLPAGAQWHAQAMRFAGRDLLAMPEPDFAGQVAGRGIAMIFQEPMTSLNPVYTVERQMTELMIRDGASAAQARERALYLLDRVRLPDPRERLRSYPHQLSGGQRQRVMIAMALMTSPQLLIADEPTTALDVTVQAQILELLGELRAEFGMAMILITHDLAVVARSVDRVMVMYGGEPLESGSTRAVLQDPRHPYTRGLLACRPGQASRHARLRAIPGIVPSLVQPWTGCVFAPRCGHALPYCTGGQPIDKTLRGPQTWFRCLNPQAGPPPAAAPAAGPGTAAARTQAPTLVARRISRTFVQRKGLFARPYTVQAVRDSSLALAQGETLAVVGESGSGKSTLARILLGLDAPDSGVVELGERPIGELSPAERASWIQPVFQDPYSSLNSRHTVGQIVARPLVLHRACGTHQAQDQAARMLQRVGLPARLLNSYPNQLSGGQRQRVAIARALMLAPRILLCDEPTSALDVSVQAQILNLLQDLQEEFGLSMLFITHDIGVVRKIADRVVVMHQGRIVEDGPAGEVLDRPSHPYTGQLLASVPSLETAFAEPAQ